MKKHIEFMTIPNTTSNAFAQCIPLSGNRVSSIDTSLRLKIWNAESGMILNDIVVGTTSKADPYITEFGQNQVAVLDAETFASYIIDIPTGKVNIVSNPRPKHRGLVSLQAFVAFENTLSYILRVQKDASDIKDYLFIWCPPEQPFGAVELEGLYCSPTSIVKITDAISVFDTGGWLTSVSTDTKMIHPLHINRNAIKAITNFENDILLGAVYENSKYALYLIQPFLKDETRNFYHKHLDWEELGKPSLITGLQKLDSTSIALWGDDLIIHDTRNPLLKAGDLLEGQYGFKSLGTVSKVVFRAEEIVFSTSGNGLVWLNRETKAIAYTYTEAPIDDIQLVNDQVIFITERGNLFQSDSTLKSPIKLKSDIKQMKYYPSFGLLAWDDEAIFLYKEGDAP